MDYAAIIWHRQRALTARPPTIQQQSKFATVQRQIMKTNLGCFRTTSTDALQNETTLLPPDLRILEKILKSATRMLTAPPAHPMHPWIQRACRLEIQSQPFQSNLVNISKHFPACLQPVETIIPFIRPPWWSLKATICHKSRAQPFGK
jgi:hypothetical protein